MTPSVVLVYHRVGDVLNDPWALAVAPEHFEEHLQVLCDLRTVRLCTLIDGLAASVPVNNCVAVSFDDGYAETAKIACPLLASCHVPATFYVPGGAVDDAREFWWDELEAELLGCSRLPECLVLDLPDGRFETALGPDASWRVAESGAAAGWRAWSVSHPTRRHSLYKSLWERCHRLSPGERRSVLAQVRAWSGGERPARETHRCMTSAEVRALATSNLFDVGAHSMTHSSLPSLPVHEQQQEICESKATLERFTGRPVETFSYPYGKPADYSDETVQLVRQAGFRGACVNDPGAIRPDTDPFRVPRLFVQDWGREQFADRIFGVSR